MSKKDETRFYFEVIDLPETIHHKGDIISSLCYPNVNEDEFCMYIWYKGDDKNTCRMMSGKKVMEMLDKGKIKYLPDYKEMITI